MQGSVKMKNYRPYKDVALETTAETQSRAVLLLFPVD